MSKLVKILFSLAMIATITAASSMWQSTEAGRPAGVTCTIDIVHTARAQDGTVLSTETYQRTFVVTENADYFVDDYSTPTRFKVFSATLVKNKNELNVLFNWFADVSVFNSVDFGSTLKLTNGQKSGEATGDYTFSSSPGHNTTTYTLVGVRN